MLPLNSSHTIGSSEWNKYHPQTVATAITLHMEIIYMSPFINVEIKNYQFEVKVTSVA